MLKSERPTDIIRELDKGNPLSLGEGRRLLDYLDFAETELDFYQAAYYNQLSRTQDLEDELDRINVRV